jgi:NADH dehydrogenase (ubiquinone) Fe-S protein 6
VSWSSTLMLEGIYAPDKPSLTLRVTSRVVAKVPEIPRSLSRLRGLPGVAEAHTSQDFDLTMLGRHALARLPRRLPALARANSSIATNPTYAAPKESEKAGAAQAPNAEDVWSNSQRARPHQHSGPRFEQMLMDMQPNPASAMAMIAEEPVRLVHGRKASCDGGACAWTGQGRWAHVLCRGRTAWPSEGLHQPGTSTLCAYRI